MSTDSNVVEIPEAPAERVAVEAKELVEAATQPIDPTRVRLMYDDHGNLRVEIEGDRCILRAKAVRAFPLTEPHRYISLLDGSNREVCLLEDPSLLDAESRAALEQALTAYYRVHRVLRVYSYRSEFRTTYWEVETERGRRDFVVKWGTDTVLHPSEHALLLIDIDGNRFSIPDLRALDEQSKRILQVLE